MNYNPILSIATATLEVGAAVWALRGPGRRPIIQAVSAILFFLAGYQIVEAIFCTGSPVTLAFLPRLAFMVVAWLPPTGLLLVARLYPGKSQAPLYYAYGMYAVCTALVAAVAMDKSFVAESVCVVVFARYTNPTPLFLAYSIFYQLGLLSMLVLSASGVTACKDDRQRLLLGQVLFGCIAFIFPAMATVAVVPIANGALPSVMCHFALLLALFLTRLAHIERRGALALEPEAVPVDTIRAGMA